jgi:catechol 2,3-dioxygenase-like lactoylglutathione lyase family enzyme
MQNVAMVFDRTEEDIGNVVELGHVNIAVPDQRLATIFYVTGLGLTRDPYLVTGTENMWVNVGKQQFHLPLGSPQKLRGTIGLVLPHRKALLARLARIAPPLEDTQFSFREAEDTVEVTCPWGNHIRCHTPDPAHFGLIALGMPYIDFTLPHGSLAGIAHFYHEILGAISGLGTDARGSHAWARVGDGNKLIFRETDTKLEPYDGHHIQITLADFSGPHRRLKERGLITEESNQHQYRFQDIVDPDTNVQLFRVEHEVRSMRHPMFARPLVNRDPDITNQLYAPEYEAARWAVSPV